MSSRHEIMVPVGEGCALWAEAWGDEGASPLILVMGANASGITWPDVLVARLAEDHRVIRYDHRDTGRSTHAFDEHPYPVSALARDVIAVMDAFGVTTAHAVGMSLGGTLLQVLLVDHPERFRSAVIFGCAALDDDDAPGPSARLMEFWSGLGAARSDAEERSWQIEHWRLLAGDVIPFDDAEYEGLEERLSDHRGPRRSSAAHARADQTGLERDLGRIRTPVLVVDAPEDPTAPPPTAERLASRIPGAQRRVIPGMGHALPRAIVDPLADAIREHTERYE